jgi:cell fate (sporulation/competence/biofilm development) regulator YlbF (YheA/YmcA/DUF963 family)
VGAAIAARALRSATDEEHTDVIADRALELGRLIGQSDEFKGLKRARQRLDEAPELGQRLRRLQEVMEGFARAERDGKDPSDDEQREYERLVSEIQADARYQGLVAAQANFDKLMFRVNERIMEGLEKGAASPIITLG